MLAPLITTQQIPAAALKQLILPKSDAGAAQDDDELDLSKKSWITQMMRSTVAGQELGDFFVS